MKEYPVITISRQYGSGGREVGQLLAKRLGIPYYDNELITLAAQESGFSPELFANADQNASNSLLLPVSLWHDRRYLQYAHWRSGLSDSIGYHPQGSGAGTLCDRRAVR